VVVSDRPQWQKVIMDRNGSTFLELSDMHLAYGVALGNAVEAQRLYQERYPNRCLPLRPIFTSIAQRLRHNYNNRRRII